MKKISLCALVLLTSSCGPSSMWDGMTTAFRKSPSRGVESRLVASSQDFFGESMGDFIPLNDHDMKSQFLDNAVPQPKEVPGELGGKIPGIDAFYSPSGALTSIFAKILFNTDQYVPKTQEQLQNLHRMSAFLKKHPNTYVFIEGHTDERASESYNLSLGTRRCNFVRNFLIKDGVNPEQLYTISFGKEKPEERGHGEKSWARNRRVSFKIYEKRSSL